MTGPLPRAAAPFVGFPALLRAHGFNVATDQTIGFLQAIELLGPESIEDIRRAGIAMLAIPHDREDEYDALFRAFFLGMTVPGVVEDDDDTVAAHEPTGTDEEAEEIDPDDEPGDEAAVTERLSRRSFADAAPDAELARFRRLAPRRLPRRHSYRFQTHKLGRMPDLRKTLRDAARRDGDVITLSMRRRKDRQRKIVVLIDVSGSMKDHTEASMILAHTLVQTAERAEVFTLGTRLTRTTPALRLRNREQALSRVSNIVSDVDGGTRIGDALAAFLAIPRYTGFVRGAAVVVLSDGLERGEPDTMIDAVRRLSRLAWRLDWLTPLGAHADYAPATAALVAILPDLDVLGDGATVPKVIGHLLSMQSAERRLP